MRRGSPARQLITVSLEQQTGDLLGLIGNLAFGGASPPVQTLNASYPLVAVQNASARASKPNRTRGYDRAHQVPSESSDHRRRCMRPCPSSRRVEQHRMREGFPDGGYREDFHQAAASRVENNTGREADAIRFLQARAVHFLGVFGLAVRVVGGSIGTASSMPTSTSAHQAGGGGEENDFFCLAWNRAYDVLSMPLSSLVVVPQQLLYSFSTCGPQEAESPENPAAAADWQSCSVFLGTPTPGNVSMQLRREPLMGRWAC